MSVPTSLHPPELPDERHARMNLLGSATGSRSGSAGVPHGSTTDLASRLFQGPERWGWEYVEPTSPARYPHLDRYPQWVEHRAPNHGDLPGRLARAQALWWRRIGIAAALAALGLFTLVVHATANGGVDTVVGTLFLASGLLYGGYGVYAVESPRSRMRRAELHARTRRDAAYAAYRAEAQRWDELIRQFDAAEERRVAGEPLLFPLAPSAGGSRVDVVGGPLPHSWAALLATAGGSLLAQGSTVLLLDLSGRNVAGPLLELADVLGGRRQTSSVPADLDRDWLLGGLPPRELVDVLVEAIDAQRGPGGAADLRGMDAELMSTVARRLERPITVERLAAGVRVLRSTYGDDETALSTAEIDALTDRIDLIDPTERKRDELGFLETQLTILADCERGGRPSGSADSLWPESGLAVLRSDERVARRKTLVDSVLIGAVAHDLATARPSCPDPVLVVAGADKLGRDALESLTQASSNAGVRLVHLFQNYREAAADMIGSGDSVTILMRLGNPDEAERAAKLVGTTEAFRVSQLSRQVGTSTTHGTSESFTDTTGGSESETTGRSNSRGAGGATGTESWSSTITESWSTSRQKGESWSDGRSNTDGQMLQRSREYTVEPDQIKILDPTTFLVVDRGPSGRRVRMADCFPGSVYVPRLSPVPWDGRSQRSIPRA